ncbi:hypothetical protein T01_9362 [Trichinella spiralis]|uniref:Uncharacterized protein n=1 Tax=Trichinella spiralis TaxID=6334 RepID=A0A0V1AUH6_TRISP|nr:hypothetical protein T01_9362 [Trichinella spiralis]
MKALIKKAASFGGVGTQLAPTALATSAHIVSVHKWRHQPPVEYEQADVSTVDVDFLQPSVLFVSKADCSSNLREFYNIFI